MFTVLGPNKNFLGIDREHSSLERAGAVMLPVPYESSDNDARGTKHGPNAILAASRSLETFDEETGRDIGIQPGVATLPPMIMNRLSDAAAQVKVHETVADLLSRSKIVGVIGGSQALSSACIAAHAKRRTSLSVLCFGAHAHCHQLPKGKVFTTGSTMVRVCEFIDPRRIVLVGVRSLSSEDSEFISEQRIQVHYAHSLHASPVTQLFKSWDEMVIEELSDEVYVTFNVDAFDPSIMPSTPCPEPNGLLWQETMACLKKLARKRTIVGFDIVGLAPIYGIRHPEITAAKLAAKILSYIL